MFKKFFLELSCLNFSGNKKIVSVYLKHDNSARVVREFGIETCIPAATSTSGEPEFTETSSTMRHLPSI